MQAFHSSSFAIETHVHPHTREIVTARLAVKGIPFLLCIAEVDNPLELGIRHPSALVFRRGSAEKILQLKLVNPARAALRLRTNRQLRWAASRLARVAKEWLKFAGNLTL